MEVCVYTEKIEDFIYHIFICDRTKDPDNVRLGWLIRMTFIWSFLILIAPFGLVAQAFGWVFNMLMTMCVLIAVAKSSSINIGNISLARRAWLFLTESPARSHIAWGMASSIMASIICTEAGFMFMEVPLNSQMIGVPFSAVLGTYVSLFFGTFAVTFTYWSLLAKPTKGVNYAT